MSRDSAPDDSEIDIDAMADDAIVARLLARDASVFEALVERHYRGLFRVARGILSTDASAEEAVQDAWIGVLKGLARFEGRAKLKTWLYRILVNRCLTGQKKERRSVPFSALGGDDDDESGLPPERFGARGGWDSPPALWDAQTPERILAAKESLRCVQRALVDLPERQRVVVVMRDVEGFASEDVCNVLEISESNQRVLLHRGRTRIREALAAELAGEDR